MLYAQLLLPDFALILCGFLLCRYTALNRPVWGAVESLVYYFLFPVLLFQSIVKTPLDLGATSSLVGAGLALSLAGIAMAYSLPYLPLLGRHLDRREHAASAQVAFRFNSFIALALAERLAGSQGLQAIAVLIGVCVPLVNVAAVWPMARNAGRNLAGELARNPLILATGCALAANLLGFGLPDWSTSTFSRIGAASVVLGLMAAGAGMQFGDLAKARALSGALLLVRHVLSPLVAVVLVRVFGLDVVQGSILLVFSALPTASSAYVLAARMGYNGGFVAGLVTVSTLLGMASLPFALSLGR